MTIELSHFNAALLFALCASTVFGITQRSTTRDMIPLRRLLLRTVHWRSDCGRLGDVGDQTLTAGARGQGLGASLQNERRRTDAVV